MKNLKETIAKNVLYYRKRLGRTQQEVATAARIAHRSYHIVEKGLENPRLDTLEGIANALEIPLLELLMDEDYQRRPTKEEAIEVILDALGIDLKNRRGPRNAVKLPKVTI